MRTLALFAAVLGVAGAAHAKDVATFAVNEYFGVAYEREPVFFDVTLDVPVPAARLGLKETPCSQVEVLEGTPAAVTRARVWTLVDFEAPGQKRFTVTVGEKTAPRPESSLRVASDPGEGRLAVLGNGLLWCKVPAARAGGDEPHEVRYDPPAPAVGMPGPVVALSRDGTRWIGSGYLDTMRRVRRLSCRLERGPVFVRALVVYEFEDDKRYRADVRLFTGKPYVMLAEDFDLGGASRFVFSFDAFKIEEFFAPGDQHLVRWKPVTEENPCGDFIRLAGQTCLARMVVWSQFNYFAGKQETLAVRAPGDDTCVGAFYLRPDRWTRAKVNHVDLYRRPEVPGDRMTRGVAGLSGARDRIAMEAWLVDGHREWALFATDSSDETFLAKAHVTEGVWPLRRIARLPLVWNADGKPVAPADTAPCGDVAHGGGIKVVLKGTKGRSGLQYFNGSNGHMRGTMGGLDYLKWAKENRGISAAELNRPVTVRDKKSKKDVEKVVGVSNRMVGWAMMAYMAMDESAYPGRRAMLPWSDPEALNPFYQGMENMNFNADRYRLVSMLGSGLRVLNQPDGRRIFAHGETQMDMALDRYVYPRSGCWEESHSYMGHTVKNLFPLAQLLREEGRRNFFEDARLARMFEFWCLAHSPRDPAFGNLRVAPPVGDHGLSVGKFVRPFRESIAEFARAQNPDVRRIARHMAWLLPEIGGSVPDDVSIEPERPDLGSRWLQGYGATMRADCDWPASWVLRLKGALVRAKIKNGEDPRRDLLVTVPVPCSEGQAIPAAAPAYNTARHGGTVAEWRSDSSGDGAGTHRCRLDVAVGEDKWVEGGKGSYAFSFTVPAAPKAAAGAKGAGTFEGTFNGQTVSGPVAAERRGSESYLVLRAGQSWGHHHEDKGSMWFWGRGVHFFGDAAWGAPPGGTYWNKYKQGPASGTQIELVGVTNWTLPCKFAAPWISDDEYGDGYDYACARCMYPFNPSLDVSKSSPVALRNGYDRQVVFVHPDILVVRDNVETVCPTVWRMHSYQPDGTTVSGGRATLASPHGVTGELAILYPPGAAIERIDKDDLMGTGEAFGHAVGEEYKRGRKAAFDTRSCVLKWEMPSNTSATWVFTVHNKENAAPKVEMLDESGRATRIRLADGTTALVLLNIEPFAFKNDGIDFEGTVGLVLDVPGQPRRVVPIRAARLTAQP